MHNLSAGLRNVFYSKSMKMSLKKKIITKL